VCVLTNSEALADHHYLARENITHNMIGCSFINAFVPEVTNEAFRASRGSGNSKSSDAKKTTLESESDCTTNTDPAANTDPPTAASTDCECTSRIALERWIESRRAKARKSIPIAAELAEAYAGSYQLPERAITLTREGERLFVDIPQGERSELFAETPTQFFLKSRQWTLTFVRDGERVVRIDILDAGETVPAPKIM
jgi:hypothetical protein